MNNYKDIYLRAQELETSNPQEAIRLLKMANDMVLRNYNPVNYNLLMRLPRLLKKLNQHELATQEEDRYKQINFYFKKQKIQNHWIDLFKKHGSFSIEIKAGSLYQPCSLHKDVWGQQIDANQQTWDLYIEPLYTVPECKCWLVYNLYSNNNVVNAKPTARQSALERAKQKLLQKRTASNNQNIMQDDCQQLPNQLAYNSNNLLEYQTQANYNNNFDDVITVKNNAVYNYNENESIAKEIQDLQNKVNNFINTIDTLPVPASKVFTVTDNSTQNSTSVANFTVDNSALNCVPSSTVSNVVNNVLLPQQHNVAGNNPFNTVTSASNGFLSNSNVAINPLSQQVSITSNNNDNANANSNANSSGNSFSSFAQNLNNLFIGNNTSTPEFKTYISGGNKQANNNANQHNSNANFANVSGEFVAKSIYTYANSNAVLDEIHYNQTSNIDTKIAEDSHKNTQAEPNIASNVTYNTENQQQNSANDDSIIKDYAYYPNQHAENTDTQSNYKVFNSSINADNNQTIIADSVNAEDEEVYINTNVNVNNNDDNNLPEDDINSDTTIVNHEENYNNNLQATYNYNLNNSNSCIVNDVESNLTQDFDGQDFLTEDNQNLNQNTNYDYGTINYSNYTNNAVDLSSSMLLNTSNSVQTNSHVANDIVLDAEDSSSLQIATAQDVDLLDNEDRDKDKALLDLPVTENSFVYKPRNNVIKDASATELPEDNDKIYTPAKANKRTTKTQDYSVDINSDNITSVHVASAHAVKPQHQATAPQNAETIEDAENNQQIAVKNNKKTSKLLWFVFFVLMIVNAILVKLKILS